MIYTARLEMQEVMMGWEYGQDGEDEERTQTFGGETP